MTLEKQNLRLEKLQLNQVSAVSEIITSNLRAYYKDAWDLEDYCKKYSPEKLSKLVSQEDMYVVINDSIILATGTIRENELKTIFVNQQFQSQGVGKWLVAALEEILREEGFNRVTVLAGKNALGFYQRLGYQETGNIYALGEDIEMEKSL